MIIGHLGFAPVDLALSGHRLAGNFLEEEGEGGGPFAMLTEFYVVSGVPNIDGMTRVVAVNLPSGEIAVPQSTITHPKFMKHPPESAL